MDASRCFDGLPPDLKTAETLDKGHGRVEIRKIAVSAEAVPHLDWPGLGQIARLERTRWIGNKQSIEIVYLITSLAQGEAGPERLMELVRNHWAIENKLHHVRDVTLNEDRCRVRAGARPLGHITEHRHRIDPKPWPVHPRGPRKLPGRSRRRNQSRNRMDF